MHIQYICMYDFLFHLRYIWLSWQLIYFSTETGFLEAKIYILNCMYVFYLSLLNYFLYSIIKVYLLYSNYIHIKYTEPVHTCIL